MTTLDFPGETERTRATAEAFADPQPGDEFTEFYSFWVVVVERDGDHVTWLVAKPPATLPQDGARFVGTVAEFGDTFAYKGIPGYFVKLNRRGMDMRWWAKR